MAAGVKAAQAGSAITGAVSTGTGQARNAFANIAGQAQSRANLIRGRDQPTPSDGTTCDGCGAPFGMFRRRSTCGSCDRFLCGNCMAGGSAAGIAGVVGITCLCGSWCPRCREQNVQQGEFESSRAQMESGVGVTICLPGKAATGFFG